MGTWVISLIFLLVASLFPATAQAYTAEEAHQIYLEAVSLSDAGKHGQAYSLIKPVAEAGFAEAQHLMGYMHGQGEGVAENPAKAVEWLEAG
ncbi:hypothetical protein [Magnetospira sp. QH-2]|uniref:hypothetical protein n=1 Tax=Magnetospira sp. (strain QH-2) TaxID=1288970 RepID=UPI0003E80BA4|nr:hypothetical protein [Magnetospira sp. QH-2]CCQ74804.1 conserved protein of unknown function (contains a TPR repeat, SEL1 subfamily) [Magnetospira sp. QH-2]